MSDPYEGEDWVTKAILLGCTMKQYQKDINGHAYRYGCGYADGTSAEWCYADWPEEAAKGMVEKIIYGKEMPRKH